MNGVNNATKHVPLSITYFTCFLGVFVIGPGQSGIYYQHHEMEFGDHANLTEVIEAVQRIEKDASKRQ